MKTSPRFEKAIKALIKGFFNGTLRKGSCAACACGNIIAAAMNEPIANDIRSEGKAVYDSWYDTVLNVDHYNDIRHSEGLEYIEMTGYSLFEFARIEQAFEENTEIYGSDYEDYSPERVMQDQYRGLCAVIDVLCDIEGLNSADWKPYFEYDQQFKPVNVLV